MEKLILRYKKRDKIKTQKIENLLEYNVEFLSEIKENVGQGGTYLQNSGRKMGV